MATVCDHLSVEELEERFVGCQDAAASRHFQVIWLLARGHTVSQVSATTAFGERWIEQLLARYNAEGPEALGDLRRRNGAPATILKPGLLARLRDRLGEPPADGGLWSSTQGGSLDGKRARPHIGRAAAGLGSVEGDRLVDPDTTSKEPQIGFARRGGGI